MPSLFVINKKENRLWGKRRGLSLLKTTHSSLSSSSNSLLVGSFISLCVLSMPSQRSTSLCGNVLSLSNQQYSDRGPRTPPQGLLSFVNYFIDTQASRLLFLVFCTFFFLLCVYRGCDILVGDLVRLITFVSQILFLLGRIHLLLLLLFGGEICQLRPFPHIRIHQGRPRPWSMRPTHKYIESLEVVEK